MALIESDYGKMSILFSYGKVQKIHHHIHIWDSVCYYLTVITLPDLMFELLGRPYRFNFKKL